VVFRNLIFNAKVVEQRLGTGVLSHHNPQASVNGDEEEHQQNACSYRRCCNSSVRIHEDFFNTYILFATVIRKGRANEEVAVFAANQIGWTQRNRGRP
jgi:hypothetical protein